MAEGEKDTWHGMDSRPAWPLPPSAPVLARPPSLPPWLVPTCLSWLSESCFSTLRICFVHVMMAPSKREILIDGPPPTAHPQPVRYMMP